MSSLLIVSRIEETRDTDDRTSGTTGPLYVGRSLLYPNLGHTVRKSEARELPFYFTLYGDAQGAQAYAELLSNGQRLAEAPVELPSSTRANVQHVGRLPIAALPAGTYELRMRVVQGQEELSRTAFFTVVD